MNGKYKYKPEGICATQIEFEVVDGKIHNVVFENGCDGNHQGIAQLAEGRPAEEVAEALSGIRCGWHDSCPNQLSVAIRKSMNE
jgi:uncharacterized protein (TIGR03905 family)